MILGKKYLSDSLNAILNLIDSLSNFKDGSFNETAHKAFSLLREFCIEYEHIYTKNMEIIGNALSPQIKSDLSPIQTKINNFIEKVNNNPDNTRLPMYITSPTKEDK